MNIGEMTDENHIQDKYTLYVRYYESCQKELDKLTQTSSQISCLRISFMELCTSIRTEDNVNEGISTFYAELLRIRKMIKVSKKQVPMISLIDEIYKGTNSKDRIFAAKETIRNLSKPYAVTLITTHDFELCDLEKELDINAKNYHFTEHYKENEILFDYKLKEGRCTTTNARYLLRMAGILR